MLLSSEQLRSFVSILDDSQLQPAGVDLSLREVYSFEDEGAVDFDNSERRLSKTKLLQFDEKGWLHLPKGAYKIVFNEIVKIPNDAAGFAFPRSSLGRCGATVHCSVWDPGYEGRSESLLVVVNEKGLRLKKNAKVVQLVFIKLEEKAAKTYQGRYHKENL